MDMLSHNLYAHTPNKAGKWHPLERHLREVSDLAARFADSFGAAELARLAGLLHDVGKYGELFQKRLRGQEHGIDHWSAGAWLALTEYHDVAAAMVVQGHHTGLQTMDKDSLRALDPERLSTNHPMNLRLSEPRLSVLVDRMLADGLRPVRPADVPVRELDTTAASMLDVRMLYSALVDADFLDTEAHFDGGLRPESLPLEPERALSALDSYVDGLSESANASSSISELRADLRRACGSAASAGRGLWTLTAPTGAGKTLAMLAFALQHAVKHRLRRIVTVIPYLTIIEQTAQVYRDVFGAFGQDYVLEHHSMAGTRGLAQDDRDEDAESEAATRARLLAENWDAPIIITTSLQMLESLFSNRPSACRKLHRLAESVILFDEVQTLPVRLAVPTLATLSALAERYRATVLFSTATQPAFSHFDEAVRQLNKGRSGWQPKEMVPADLNLFARSRRTHVRWPESSGGTSWQQIASELSNLRQALCVVNTKRHARELFQLLQESRAEGLFHLSTAMCPAHRQAVLAKVRDHLDPEKNQPCLLISTQCVEAGVDVDFPVAYRAFGPLEAIAQVAGRCNRNANRETGDVVVFLPEDERYPPGGSYEQAAAMTKILLNSRGAERMDINDPELFQEYYKLFYDLTKAHEQCDELIEAIRRQDFPEVARLYRLIREDSINVVVPYAPDGRAKPERYEALKAEVMKSGLTGRWMREARPYTVGVYRPRPDDLIWQHLLPVPYVPSYRQTSTKGEDGEWFIYEDYGRGGYDPDVGLLPPDAPPLWSA